MAKKPIQMRHIQEILRLKHEKELSVRVIARSCGLPSSTVGDYLNRAARAALGWPLPAGLNEEELRARLMNPEGKVELPAPVEPERPQPQWSKIHEELRRKGVTLRLLWEEYRRDHHEGYGYSRFCELYQIWAGTIDPVMRQHHEPGEKMFVDWAGQKIPIHNSVDGSIGEASLFIATLGASNKTFAEAFPNEQTFSWIKAHIHAFEYFNGVSRAVVPDYVSGHIIDVLFPAGLCARLVASDWRFRNGA